MLRDNFIRNAYAESLSCNIRVDISKCIVNS